MQKHLPNPLIETRVERIAELKHIAKDEIQT
jgi:hypothetical protein